MKRADLAEEIGESRSQPSGGFARALTLLVDRGAIVRPRHGVYALAGTGETST
jgi:hypothetical protein